MLQILVYGPQETNWLDLEPNATLEFEEVDPLFDDEETVTGQYTLPISIPWTERNRRLLGFAERVHNFSNAPGFFKCDVYAHGWVELQNAKLNILEKIGDWTYLNGSFNANITSTKGLLGSLVKNKKMNTLNWGPVINFNVESRQFAQQVMTGQLPQYSHIVFCPVAIENFFDQGRPDYDNEFLAKDTVNNIIISNGTWLFARPRPNAPNQPTNDTLLEHKDYRTIPFFKMQWVVKQLFAMFGFTVSGAVVDDKDFEDLLLFNNFAMERYISASDRNRQLRIENHMPDVLVEEFIDAFKKTFKLKLDFNGTNAIFSYKKNVLGQPGFADVTSYATRRFTSKLPVQENNNGLTIQYAFDGQDQYPGERLKELSTRNFAATVATLAELPTLNIGRQLTTDDYVYCQQDNLFYLVADATNPDNIKYDCWAEDMYALVTGNGEVTVDLPIAPLFQYVEFNKETSVWERRNYLACRMPGSYTNNAGNPVYNSPGLRMFFGGITNMFGFPQPASWNWNRHAANNSTQQYNLALKHTGSLGKELHQQWETFVNTAEVVETNLVTDRKVDYLLRQNTQVGIAGIVFYKRKRERRIPAAHTEKVELVVLNNNYLNPGNTNNDQGGGSVSDS